MAKTSKENKVKTIYMVMDGAIQGELTLKEARELVANSKLSFKDIEASLYPELTMDAVKTLADSGIIEYPEKGHFATDKDLKKFYKKLTDAQITEWLELEGITYKASEHEAINRMRMCMAILYYHFPKPEAKGKKNSKYADLTTEQLVAMAAEAEVEYKDSDDNRILRMRVIMALREAGYVS